MNRRLPWIPYAVLALIALLVAGSFITQKDESPEPQLSSAPPEPPANALTSPSGQPEQRSSLLARMDPSRRPSESGAVALVDHDSEEGRAYAAATEAMIAAHGTREEQAAQHKERIASHLKSGDVLGAFDYIQTIPSEELRQRAFVDFVDQWSLDDPLEAGNWVRDTYGEPFSDDALKAVMRNWSGDAPQDAAEWAQTLDDPQMRLRGLMWGFTVWAESDAYVDAADWINAQPATPDLDIPREMVAHKMFQVQPETGLEWAESLPNAQRRSEVLWDFYESWLNTDRETAGAHLDQNASISPGYKRRLLAGEIRD